MSKEQQYKYPDFKDWKWREFYTPKIVSLDAFLEKNAASGRDFHIGTDSQNHGKNTFFSTAIIAHTRHTGGSVIIHKDHTPAYTSLQQKLIIEAMRTLEAAWYLSQKFTNDRIKIRLHLDVNEDIKFKSGQYKEKLVGLIMGQGYEDPSNVKNPEDHPRLVFWKPEAWAASNVADRNVK